MSDDNNGFVDRDEFQAHIDAVQERYQYRIIALLEQFRLAFIEAGLSCSEQWAWHDQMDTRWSFLIRGDGTTFDETKFDGLNESTDIDFSFQIISEFPEGMTFAIDLVATGGSMVGGYCPYNYTDEIWVDPRDESAIEERFSLFLNPDFDGAVKRVEEFCERYAS